MRIPKLACLTTCLILSAAPVFAADALLPKSPGIHYEVDDSIVIDPSGTCPKILPTTASEAEGYSCIIRIYPKDAPATTLPTFNLNQTINMGGTAQSGKSPDSLLPDDGDTVGRKYKRVAPDDIVPVPGDYLPFTVNNIYKVCEDTSYPVSAETARHAYYKYHWVSMPTYTNDGWYKTNLAGYWIHSEYKYACRIIQTYTDQPD